MLLGWREVLRTSDTMQIEVAKAEPSRAVTERHFSLCRREDERRRPAAGVHLGRLLCVCERGPNAGWPTG